MAQVDSAILATEHWLRHTARGLADEITVALGLTNVDDVHFVTGVAYSSVLRALRDAHRLGATGRSAELYIPQLSPDEFRRLYQGRFPDIDA